MREPGQRSRVREVLAGFKGVREGVNVSGQQWCGGKVGPDFGRVRV